MISNNSRMISEAAMNKQFSPFGLGLIVASSAVATCLTEVSAEEAKIVSGQHYIGTCTYSSSDKVKGINQTSIPCDPNLRVLHYSDHFTLMQFGRSADGGKDKITIAFVGPQWLALDDLHMSMVIDDVLFTNLSNNSQIKRKYSGFCLITLEAPGSDNIVSHRCEYLSGADFNVFTLNNITKYEGGS